MEHNKKILTRGRLNKMLKYFKNKKVNIAYHMNDEVVESETYSGNYFYDSFEIEDHPNGWIEFTLYLKDEIIFNHGMYNYQCEFIGVGKIKESNNGPYCYLIVKN